MTYQTRNWVSAILTTGLLVVLALALTPFTVERSADPYLERPSTFFTDASGARALLLVLKELLPSVEQWRRPLNLLPLPTEPDAPATLIAAGPQRSISKSEADHLDRWLAAGGQLILASDDGWRLASRRRPEDNDETPADAPEPGQKTTENYLSRHAADVRWSERTAPRTERIAGSSVPGGELTVQVRQTFAAVKGAKIIASTGGAPLAVEIPVGGGRIVALADSTMVSNRALGAADNAVWLVALAAGRGHGKILIDEFHHGFGKKRSASELAWAFLKTPWGWCAAQLAAAGLFYVFAYRRRFGRISEPPAPERASPLELVDARAGFFQAAEAQKLAVELIVQNLAPDSPGAGKSSRLSIFGRKAGDGALFARLENLSAKAARGKKLTASEFVEIGRIAGQIQQGSPHEHLR